MSQGQKFKIEEISELVAYFVRANKLAFLKADEHI